MASCLSRTLGWCGDLYLFGFVLYEPADVLLRAEAVFFVQKKEDYPLDFFNKYLYLKSEISITKPTNININIIGISTKP